MSQSQQSECSLNKCRRDLQSNLSAFKKLNPENILAKGCLKEKITKSPCSARTALLHVHIQALTRVY